MNMTKRSTFLVLLAVAGGCGDSAGGTTPDAGAGAADAAGIDAVVADAAPVTVTVSSVFPAGTALRDRYSGNTLVVAADGTVTMTPGPNGVALLEKDGAAASAFSWANVTVYHAIVDRFVNGDTSNDASYGRKKDGQMEIGTWHGGDWKGLATKLDYLVDLGVSAIWISPIVENVHGWAAGGNGTFKHYGYHGYWALDFTRLDQNLGTEADLEALVDGAHQRGLRVLVDVVLNHPGYATGADLTEYLPEVFTDRTGAAFANYDRTATGQFNDWNGLVNYSSVEWKSWWSPKWIRAGFPGFPPAGSTDFTRQLDFLPDFITESTEAADAPVLLTRKTDSGFEAQAGFTVRQYLVKWHTDWVRRFGFDGFRVDTVKNVEPATFRALKEAGVAALAEWKAANTTKKLDDAPFWMTAEVFPHGVMKDDIYAQGGFDSVINFDLQGTSCATDVTSCRPYEMLRGGQLAASATDLEALYARYSSAVSGDPGFGILSYLSSHDTRLIFPALGMDAGKQRQAGTALLLAPGGVNIFYGDESGRRPGFALNDPTVVTRSDMNFGSIDASILQHWQKLGTFRRDHAAVGAGVHQKLTSPAGTYAFSRKLGDDAVIVILTSTR
jgi:alpha-amylase